MASFSVEPALRLAQEHHMAGRLREAEGLYRQILQHEPDHPSAIHHLGLIAHQVGQHSAAIPLMERSIALQPHVVFYHKNLGTAYQAAERFVDAERCHCRAIELAPHDSEAHHGLGVALEKQERRDEAIVQYRLVLEARPDHAAANHNLGMLMLAKGRRQEAMIHLDRAIATRPDYPLARISRAALSLRSGRFVEGWEDYEWRFHLHKQYVRRPDTRHPVWNGEDLRGRTILVRAEQGLGDTLFCARYFPLLAERGARVMVEVQSPVKSLIDQVKGVTKTLELGEPPPPFDVQAMMMSLPRAFNTRLETIPAEAPYLKPDDARAAAWRERLANDSTMRVGLVWRVGPKQPDARNRSLRLADLATLARPDVTFFGLQKEDPEGESASPPAGMRFVDLSGDLRDFAETAAVIANLDLVISADTAVVNLAGAMGKPTWVFVPFVADWRWLVDREDSPWYPTVHIFRKAQDGTAADLTEKIARRLDMFVLSRR